ncbi:MAG TPA: hypothetical protein VFP98_08475, partial [Candidatus Polarisedimenticolia bacterium]|nr:hypothetical protein [Candidatus Polarisedimenticolia bacterium]
AVYVPQSYNFAGNLLVVPGERVRALEVASSDVMTFLVSGGVSGTLRDPRPSPRLAAPGGAGAAG